SGLSTGSATAAKYTRQPMSRVRVVGILLNVSAALFVSAACGREAQGPQSQSSPAQPAPSVRVYVTNEMSGDLTIIDARTESVVATAPLGKRPRGIKASP